MTRIRPENRRQGEMFDVSHNGVRYHVTLGKLKDGSLIEVFISCRKTASDLESLARDAGLILSFAIQHGATAQELKSAVSRGDHDEPTSIIGAVLDALSS